MNIEWQPTTDSYHSTYEKISDVGILNDEISTYDTLGTLKFELWCQGINVRQLTNRDDIL